MANAPHEPLSPSHPLSVKPNGHTTQLLLLLGLLSMVVAAVAGQLSQERSWLQFLDNLHWTASSSVAAVLAWQYRNTTAAHGQSLRWMAYGLIAYALGQVLWDVQSLIGYGSFPAPADLFYLMLGPCLIVALVREIQAQTTPVQRPMIWLDSALLSVAMLTLILVLYIPKRGDTGWLPLLTLIAYPTTLFAAAALNIIMIPSLRLRPDAGLLLFLGALLVNGTSWMAWNAMTLEGIPIDGVWFNLLFSMASLSFGYSLTRWRAQRRTDPAWERQCEGALRLLPLVAVIVASLAVVLSHTLSQLATSTQFIADLGCAVVIMLAVLRQNATLKERDQLLATQQALLISQRELGHDRGLLKSLVGAIPDLVWLKDPEGRYLSCNARFEQFFGARESEILGKTDHDFVSAELADFFRHHDHIAMHASRPCVNQEYLTFAQDGYQGLFETTKTATRDQEGHLIGVLGIARDITERKQAEERIRELAFFDPLTTLPNRTLLLDRLHQRIAVHQREKGFSALLFLDLDRFKTLNDTLGHDMGDLMLQQAGQRLCQCVRDADTVARLGGDEFVVMLTGLGADLTSARASTETVATKILRSLHLPYQLQTSVHHSSASIGATLFGEAPTSADSLLKQADLAMYVAKAAGRNNVRFFDPAMEDDVLARAALEADLRVALQTQQLVLHYQAQLNAQGLVTGVEALARWCHPTRGMVSPAQFIPMAEATGLILPLGHWVLVQACAQLARWRQQPALAALTLSVNISAHQLRQDDFVAQVQTLLLESGAPPARLCLELTESVLVTNLEEVIQTMTDLKALGVCFSLDDFGTGFSSLTYLKRLPLDELKIDQSFVRDVLTDANDAALVKTIVALASNLALRVMAEGVETPAQRDFLAQAGCHAYQGYLFHRPAPVAQLEAFVRAGPSHTGAVSPL